MHFWGQTWGAATSGWGSGWSWGTGTACIPTSPRSLRVVNFLRWKSLHMVNLTQKIHFRGRIWGAATSGWGFLGQVYHVKWFWSHKVDYPQRGGRCWNTGCPCTPTSPCTSPWSCRTSNLTSEMNFLGQVYHVKWFSGQKFECPRRT